MPNTTGDYPMPYPNSSAVPDVPGDILALAQEVDDTLTAEFAALPVPGSNRVIPTSVAGTGVSVSTTTGLVTFSASTTVTVDGCFTADYRRYEIRFDSSGTAGAVTMQLRASGSTSATGYDLTENLARNATASSSTALNQTAWAISGGNSTRYAGDVTVFAPFVALETAISSRVGQHNNPAASSTANALKVSYGTHRTASAYDGFILTFSASQSGTLSVVGLI